MSENAKQPKQIATEHQFVQMQVGFAEVPASEFETQWNNGNLNLQMEPVSGVTGPCTVGRVVNILEATMREHWKLVSDEINYKEVHTEKFGRIAIAKALDGGKKFAIGVLEYNVVSLEKWEKQS